MVNILTLQKMGQERDEGVLAFIARLNGQVSLCDLEVTCPSTTCGKRVSFADRYKTLQLIHGLYDKDIQEKVLAAGAALGEGEEMSLAEVTKMVQAAEMGKTTYKQLSTAGGICRLSDHQRSKGSSKTDKFQSKSKAKDDKQRSSCMFCGREMHERDQCPAKESTCSKCG